MGLAVGIDLGTTNSAVAVLDQYGHPYVVPNGDGDTTTPSIVCFRDGNVLVGAEAGELRGFEQWPVAEGFKRMMGDGAFVFHAAGRDLTATELSSLVLEKLKSDAQDRLGRNISHAVITVPAKFRDTERNATIEAGRSAGLEVLQVINEPTAAAVAYGVVRDNRGRLVVYDLGGGTFDVTVLDVVVPGGSGEIRVCCSSGDDQLGGRNWDDRIINWLADQFVEEFGVDPRDDYEGLADLRFRAEAAKKQLSARLSTVVRIAHGGKCRGYQLTRTTVEEITHDLLERTISLTRHALDDVGCTPDDIDGVLLVGGSSRMPAVRHRVKEVFGQAPTHRVNGDEAVALGAAIVAASYGLTDGLTDFSDVTNHSLGMIATSEDGTAYVNNIILARNREIPCEETRQYGQRNDRMEIFMTQGESGRPDDVDYVGKYVVSGIPRHADRDTVVDVTYHYDQSGTVAVSASTKESGTSRHLPVVKEDLPTDVPGRFLVPPEPPGPEQMTVYIAVDRSGSMVGEPLIAAKKAALDFMCSTDRSRCSMGVIAFADRVKTILMASEDAADIKAAIRALDRVDVGGGTCADPFPEIARVFQEDRRFARKKQLQANLIAASDGDSVAADTGEVFAIDHRYEGLDHLEEREVELSVRQGTPESGRCFAIVLTDGHWYCDRDAAKRNARFCHRKGIEVIAIGFGNADKKFLRKIASSNETAFYTRMNQLGSTFSTIGRVLTETGGDTGRLSRAVNLATRQ